MIETEVEVNKDLEKALQILEHSKIATELAYAEVIIYNKKNLERKLQNESRQYNRQQGRAKRREEEIYEQSNLYKLQIMKVYPDDTWDYATYINNPDKTIFLAYSDAGCVGQIVLKRDWNRYAFIEDICVAKSERGQGIGTC